MAKVVKDLCGLPMATYALPVAKALQVCNSKIVQYGRDSSNEVVFEVVDSSICHISDTIAVLKGDPEYFDEAWEFADELDMTPSALRNMILNNAPR